MPPAPNQQDPVTPEPTNQPAAAEPAQPISQPPLTPIPAAARPNKWLTPLIAIGALAFIAVAWYLVFVVFGSNGKNNNTTPNKPASNTTSQSQAAEKTDYSFDISGFDKMDNLSGDFPTVARYTKGSSLDAITVNVYEKDAVADGQELSDNTAQATNIYYYFDLLKASYPNSTITKAKDEAATITGSSVKGYYNRYSAKPNTVEVITGITTSKKAVTLYMTYNQSSTTAAAEAQKIIQSFKVN